MIVRLGIAIICMISLPSFAQSEYVYLETTTANDSLTEASRQHQLGQMDSLSQLNSGATITAPSALFGSSVVKMKLKADTLFLDKTEQDGPLQSAHDHFYWLNNRLHFFKEASQRYQLGQQPSVDVKWVLQEGNHLMIGGINCQEYRCLALNASVWMSIELPISYRPPVNTVFPKGAVVKYEKRGAINLSYLLQKQS